MKIRKMSQLVRMAVTGNVRISVIDYYLVVDFLLPTGAMGSLREQICAVAPVISRLDSYSCLSNLFRPIAYTVYNNNMNKFVLL